MAEFVFGQVQNVRERVCERK